MTVEMRPQARTDGLVVRELPDEVLVYDTESHEAHCLNATAALVWRRCNGSSTVSEIAASLAGELGEADEEVVWLALEELWKRQLLVGEEPVAEESGMSRSTLLRRVGVGAAVVSLPAIASLVAPSAAHAVTPCIVAGQPCSPTGTPCCPGLTCTGGTCQ